MLHKITVLLCLTALLCASLTGCREDRREDFSDNDAKPVIYLYPEKEAEVNVRLDYDGELTCTYPAYGEDGWTVTAAPDGTLTDKNGQTYNYLYWEGVSNGDCDFSRGFCVPGENTAAFLEESLEKLGLTRREANEFIVYWLPRMEANAFNLIAFQFDDYTSRARLTITPQPDSLLRVFMAWRPLAEPVEIPEQDLPAFQRTGFAAVEWGGTELPFLTAQEAKQLIAPPPRDHDRGGGGDPAGAALRLAANRNTVLLRWKKHLLGLRLCGSMAGKNSSGNCLQPHQGPHGDQLDHPGNPLARL